MKKLMIYLRDYRRESVLAPLFKLLEALFDLLVPLVVARIIDVGIADGNRPMILRLTGLMILLAAVGLVCSITAQYFAAKASAGFGAQVRQALFDHIQGLSYADLDSLGTDTLITRLTSDVNQVQTGLNMALRLLLRSPFIVFGSMVMAFTINLRAALVFVVAIPLLSAVVYGIMIASIPLFRKVQAKLDLVLGLTRENLTGVRVIRAFCKEQDEIREFDEKNDDLTRMNLFVGRLSAVMNPATYALINLATIVLIEVGAVQVNLGSIRQGDVVALYNYMAQMIVELIKLASLIITINKALACADRISGVLDVKSGMEYPTAAISAGIEKENARNAVQNNSNVAGVRIPTAPLQNAAVQFDHVSFAYAGAGANSLEDITFTAKPGQTIGIIGGTGSGKSTLVNLIPRFYDATAGEVLVDGRDVRDYAEGELVQRIGVVPQKAQFFEGTIRDNLKWGRQDAADGDLWQAVCTAQAEEVVRGKAGGLDFCLEQNGRNLSGGQRQRLTIARALVKNPEILILDDSASALDFATDAALRKAIREKSREAEQNGNPLTTFIVSQRCSSIRYADQILVLNDGKLAGLGTHEELMKACPVYQEIYYSQYPEDRPSGGFGSSSNFQTVTTGNVVEDRPAADFGSSSNFQAVEAGGAAEDRKEDAAR